MYILGKKIFGNRLIGYWICFDCPKRKETVTPYCSYTPGEISKLDKENKVKWTSTKQFWTRGLGSSKIYNALVPKCPNCGKELIYDEAE